MASTLPSSMVGGGETGHCGSENGSRRRCSSCARSANHISKAGKRYASGMKSRVGHKAYSYMLLPQDHTTFLTMSHGLVFNSEKYYSHDVNNGFMACIEEKCLSIDIASNCRSI